MIKAITGTKDILPEEIYLWHNLENLVRGKFAAYNYAEIRTPIFEETALFKRGIGDETDIVSKEMYTFTDRGGTSLTLKPEMTAAVMRAFIEHSLVAKQQLNKVYYISPMFRQERPQAGRLRQFHQFGAEIIAGKSPILDAEIVILAYDIIKSFGVGNLELKINSLGMPDSRAKYKELLKEYLQDSVSELSEESKKRYETNILRLFDSKDANDNRIMANAPKLIDHLDTESLDHFCKVKELLDTVGIKYTVDPALVRGLDYYTDTTFEIVSNSVGSQSALCGGGRYDLLAEQIGGKSLPGVGFAAGMERLLLALKNEGNESAEKPGLDFYIVRFDAGIENTVYSIAQSLRNKGLSVEIDYLSRSVKAQMREANKTGAKNVLFVGGSEWEEGVIKVKRMADGFETTLPKENYLDGLMKIVRQ